MGDPFEARSPGDAALALGVELADLPALIDSGVLRVLPVAGGGWITSDAAIVRAANLRAGKSAGPRRRGAGGRRRKADPTPSDPSSLVAPRRATKSKSAAPATVPPRAAMPATTTPPVVPTKQKRSVAVDARPDVNPNARLDMRSVAERLQLDERTVTRLAREGTLKATRLGREWVTTERAVRDYQRRNQPPLKLPRSRASRDGAGSSHSAA